MIEINKTKSNLTYFYELHQQLILNHVTSAIRSSNLHIYLARFFISKPRNAQIYITSIRVVQYYAYGDNLIELERIFGWLLYQS